MVVPDLARDQVIGGWCCAITADDAIVERLSSWRGVRAARVDLDEATVDLDVDLDVGVLGPTAEDLAGELEVLGYRPVAIEISEDG